MTTLSDPADCAGLWHSQRYQLGLDTGAVFAVPAPDVLGSHGRGIETAINQALQDAEEGGVKGKKITPFLLARVAELTEGKSLAANIALVKNNAKFGAQLARSLSAVGEGAQVSSSSNGGSSSSAPVGRPVVIGGAVMDLVAGPETPGSAEASSNNNGLTLHTSNPGSLAQSLGGVGRNVTESLHRLDTCPLLFTAIGSDLLGKTLLTQSESLGLDTSRFFQHEALGTAVYNAVVGSDGELHVAIFDGNVLDTLTPDTLQPHLEQLATAGMLCWDGNVPEETVEFLLAIGKLHNIPTWFEPTSVFKALLLSDPAKLADLRYISPNTLEAGAMLDDLTTRHPEALNQAREKYGLDSVETCQTLLQPVPEACHGPALDALHLAATGPTVILSLGPHGKVVVQHAAGGAEACPKLELKYFGPQYGLEPTDPLNEPSIVNVTGAGDSGSGALISGLLRGLSMEEAVKGAIKASLLSLEAQHAISPELNAQALGWEPL